MDVYCDSGTASYLDQLADDHPIMIGWKDHPDDAIIYMARIGNLYAIKNMNCRHSYINGDLMQQIANIAARYGHMNIIEWVMSNAYIDTQLIAYIARDAGYTNIASYADGYEYVIEEEEFPMNLSGLTGDPNEDKAKWIFDYRMQDYREEFLPEDPLLMEDDGYDVEDPYNLDEEDNDDTL